MPRRVVLIRACHSLLLFMAGTLSIPALAQPFVISGVVTDALSGSPVSQARVRLVEPVSGDTLTENAWTDSRGQYRLELQAVGTERPSVPAYSLGDVYPNPRRAGIIEIPYTAWHEHDGTPALEVYDVLGRRVEGAARVGSGVYFYRLRFPNGQRTEAKSFVLAEGGSFEVRLVPSSQTTESALGKRVDARADYRVVVEKPGFIRSEAVVDLTSGEYDRDFVLTRSVGGRARLVVNARTPEGVLLPDVLVEVPDLGLSGYTNEFGEVALDSVYTGVGVTLRLSKAGYMTQFVRAHVPNQLGMVRTPAVLPALADAIPLADAAAGGAAEGVEGTRLELPPDGLIRPDGTPVTGPVNLHMTPINVMTDAGLGAFPGDFLGIDETGREGRLLSYGVTDFVVEQGGEELDLAPGQTAMVEMPLYATLDAQAEPLVPGDEIPIWGLGDATGVWQFESVGTVVASAASPTGLALRGAVSHFSPFNCDVSPVAAASELFALLDDDTCEIYGGNPIGRCTGYAGYAEFAVNLPEGYPTDSGKSTYFVYDPETGVAEVNIPDGVSRATMYTSYQGFTMSTFLPPDVDAELEVTTQPGRLSGREGLWVGRWTQPLRAEPNGSYEFQIEFEYQSLTDGGRNERLMPPVSVLRGIEPEGELDSYWFEGAEGVVARLEACRLFASTLEGRITLRSPEGPTLGVAAISEDCGRIDRQLPASGAYSISVAGLDGTTGGYDMTLSLSQGIGLLTYYDSTFTDGSTAHTYGFSIDSPQTILVGTRPTSGSVLGMRTELEDADGERLGFATANTLSSAEVVMNLDARTYYVNQILQGSPPAGYTFAVLSIATPEDVAVGARYEQTVENPFMRQRFRFEIDAERTVTVTTERPDNAVWIWTRILDEEGNQLAETLNNVLTETLPAGTYLLEQDPHLMHTGAYAFTITTQ